MRPRSSVAAALLLALAATGAVAAPPALGGPGQTAHQAALEERSRAVVAYPLTLDRLAAFAAAVRELRAAAEQEPGLGRRLLEQGAPGESLAEAARRLDGVASLQAVLAGHGLWSRDVLLLPSVLLAGRSALMAEQAGQPGPADQVNSSSLRLHRDQPARVAELTAAFRADLRALERAVAARRAGP